MDYGAQSIDLQALKEFTSLLVILGTMVAYLLGNLLDKFARQWQRFFVPKDSAKRTLDAFKANHPQFTYKFQHTDADIIRAFIKRIDPDTASTIEKHGATRTMFRNISLNLVFLSIIFLVQAIVTSHWVIYLSLCILTVIFSIISGQQGARYDEWYHVMTYEAAVAASLKPESFVNIKKKTSSK